MNCEHFTPREKESDEICDVGMKASECLWCRIAALEADLKFQKDLLSEYHKANCAAAETPATNSVSVGSTLETESKPLSEKCPKCGKLMFNWPGQMTRCAKCSHEWYMDSTENRGGK